MKFKGKLIITDPCYITKDQDWDDPYELTLSSNGVTAISENTGIGDGTWQAYRTDRDPWEVTKEIQEWIDNNSAEGRTDSFYDKLESKIQSYAKENLGKFCADAGMSCVAELESLKAYNPEAEEFINEHGWCVAELPDFDGDVYSTRVYFPGSYGYEQLVFVGVGNYNFFTI